ncbi:GPI transamidase component PIG-S [Vanrija pseudolonga]|uniref:GPI transamidase component PIG-S n=1 Tax=Vanrija pseudolonga TaxID=143232 RepID=A0AAF1BIE7_9TREE|nr:GPI transamidase component PIG-S [Vanrija pseudolonga]
MSKSDPPEGGAPAATTPTADSVLAAINPPTRKRLLVALCFPLFVLLAAPYWWWATAIERLPLPAERIAALELTPTPDITTRILFTAGGGAFPTPPEGRANFPLRTKLQVLGQEVTKGVDGILAQKKPAERGQRRWELVYDGDAALRVHIAVSSAANASFPLEPYVSTAGSDSLPDGTLVVPVHPGQVSDLNLKRHYKIALINGIHNLLPPHLPGIPVRALAYRPNITLSFVLVNEDAADGSYVSGWDVEGALRDHFLPQITPLAPVFNFSIESQVLYHAPLTFEPDHAEGDGWRINDEQLKIFVSERWSLDSGSTNNPVLRFLIFVPSATHRPLHLGAENGDAFLIPQFGSAVLLNPPDGEAKAYRLTLDALDAPFAQFVEHFYQLLSIPARPSQVHVAPGDDDAGRGLASPLSPWQLDTVLRTRLAENTAEAKKTLASMVRLIAKIEEMKVGAGVRDKILGAVSKLEGLPATARANSPRAAFVLSRDAVALANEAFFDPSMMGLLYFPDQHKFAVYTPLFAPICVTMIAGLLRELRAWIKRRKARKAAAAAPAAGKSSTATSTATPAPNSARQRTVAATAEE